jgi:SAM-dependent methyltransferase
MTSHDFWDAEITEHTHSSWMERMDVRLYINEAVSGKSGWWPLDWFQLTFPEAHFRRVLSIGCGTGPLERDLIRRGICDVADAFDGSVHSLYRAELESLAEGMAGRIRYFAWDFNEPHLKPGTYDAVFFHQSLHHVAKLEKLMRAILRSLKPGGMLYLDEYIGPSRHDWNDQTIQPFRAEYNRLPRSNRAFEQLPLPIHPTDPSEAFRSSEIMKQLRIGFDVTHFRGYGGNLLAVLFPSLTKPDDDLVRDLIEREKALLARGENHYHAIVVARPKKGLAKALASARYFVEPKLKRIGREIKQRLPLP